MPDLDNDLLLTNDDLLDIAVFGREHADEEVGETVRDLLGHIEAIEGLIRAPGDPSRSKARANVKQLDWIRGNFESQIAELRERGQIVPNRPKACANALEWAITVLGRQTEPDLHRSAEPTWSDDDSPDEPE